MEKLKANGLAEKRKRIVKKTLSKDKDESYDDWQNGEDSEQSIQPRSNNGHARRAWRVTNSAASKSDETPRSDYEAS